MCSIRVILYSVVILNVIYEINSLVRIPLPADNDIITAETIIRKTINKLFSNLRFSNKTKKINDSNVVHNFFTSLTLQDYKTLQNVDSVSRVPLTKTNDSDYVNVLNEILNEEEINETNTSNSIPKIEGFLRLINQYSKEMKSSGDSLDINAEIIKLLEQDKKVESNSVNSTENYSLLSDNEFWEPNGRRIYRGELTKIKYFPFMAVVQFFERFTCAGSIIKSDLIISAASCLQLAYNNRFFRENPSFLSVRIGSTFYNGGGEVIPVQEVYFHPRYNPRNLLHNLCLMRLVRKLKFRTRERRVRKIDFDRSSSSLSMYTNRITVVGWGAQDSSNIIHEPWKNRIAFANLGIYPMRECQQIYSEEYVTVYNFCAGFISMGGGACNQDVGGPGIVKGKLAGVISFGSPVCGARDAPTVFTKVGFYTDWIEEIMEQDVPRYKKRTTLKEPFTYTFPPTYNIGTTRFKIPPVEKSRELEPLLPENKRTEEEVFNEFLKTMFDSKEVDEYMERKTSPTIVGKMVEHNKVVDKDDVIEEDEQEINFNEFKDSANSEDSKHHHKSKKQLNNEGYRNWELATKSPLDYPNDENEKLEDTTRALKTKQAFDLKKIASTEDENSQQTSEEVTEKPGKYTVMDVNLLKNEEKQLENDIVNIIDDIQLGKLLETESSDQSEGDNNKLTEKTVTGNKKKNKDVSKLTLLYLSDEEKEANGGLLVNEGMSIPVEHFKDFTHRNNENQVLDLLPHEDLFKLLNEAIKTK